LSVSDMVSHLVRTTTPQFDPDTQTRCALVKKYNEGMKKLRSTLWLNLLQRVFNGVASFVPSYARLTVAIINAQFDKIPYSIQAQELYAKTVDELKPRPIPAGRPGGNTDLAVTITPSTDNECSQLLGGQERDENFPRAADLYLFPPKLFPNFKITPLRRPISFLKTRNLQAPFL